MWNTRATRMPEWAFWIIGAVTMVAAAILILAVVLGVRAGQQQIEIQARQQVGIHLQRAVDLRAEGSLEAALAEYQQVMLLDPGNVAAVEGIESLLSLARGEAALPAVQPPAPANGDQTPPAVESPLETPLPTLSEQERQWADAQAAYAAGRWADAIEQLEEIRRVDPQFAPDAVADALFTAYVNLSAEKDQAGNLEEALSLVDAALELRPDAAELRQARGMAAQYLDVLTYFGADWDEAVALLNELYLLDPAYRDVEPRLQEALVALGDDLADATEWCEAAEQYILAIELDVTPGLIDKRDAARDRCRSGTRVAAAASTRATSTRTPRVGTRTSTPSPTADSADGTAGTARRTPTPATAQRATAGATPTERPTAAATATEAAGTSTPGATPTAAPAPASALAGRVLLSAVSPDDNRSRIYAIDADSGQARLIVEDGIQPALRADGERLAYYNTREDRAGISSFDPGTGLALRFTQFAEDRRPSWSPDGNRIVFGSNREGDRRWRIYVAWAEVDGEATGVTFGESPAWRPGADRIVYRGCDDTGNRCGLWTMTSAGSGRAPLTSVPEDTLPAWSPDGRYVVFTSSSRHGNYDVYRADAQTGDVLRLTDSPGNDGVAAVSPDGDWVAFLSDRGGVWRLWAVPLAGGDAVEIADLPGGVGNWLEQNLQWVP